MANMFEPIVVDGLEVATLCATIGQLPADKLFEFDTVVLPTNEATQLRCIKWRLCMPKPLQILAHIFFCT